MKTGIELIAAERDRQINVEGWTPEHDDKHWDGELSRAAACYCNPTYSADPRIGTPIGWPWSFADWKPAVQRGGTIIISRLIRQYVKAGALIAAEIDRLLRAYPEVAETLAKSE